MGLYRRNIIHYKFNGLDIEIIRIIEPTVLKLTDVHKTSSSVMEKYELLCVNIFSDEVVFDSLLYLLSCMHGCPPRQNATAAG